MILCGCVFEQDRLPCVCSKVKQSLKGKHWLWRLFCEFLFESCMVCSYWVLCCLNVLIKGNIDGKNMKQSKDIKCLTVIVCTWTNCLDISCCCIYRYEFLIFQRCISFILVIFLGGDIRIGSRSVKVFYSGSVGAIVVRSHHQISSSLSNRAFHQTHSGIRCHLNTADWVAAM